MGVSQGDNAVNSSDEPKTVPVLNIIGPVGIGKTSIAFAISDIFQYDYAKVLPHALIDLDDVRRAWPTPEGDPFNMAVGFKNLVAVWRNYQETGARCLIIPSVMESPEDFDSIRTAVPGADIFVVRLTAPLHVNHERIRGREKTEDDLKWHLDRSTQLAQELAEKKLEHMVVDTEDKQPKEIAQEIFEHWGILKQFGINGA
jgi:adenylylsulfate kinase